MRFRHRSGNGFILKQTTAYLCRWWPNTTGLWGDPAMVVVPTTGTPGSVQTGWMLCYCLKRMNRSGTMLFQKYFQYSISFWTLIPWMVVVTRALVTGEQLQHLFTIILLCWIWLPIMHSLMFIMMRNSGIWVNLSTAHRSAPSISSILLTQAPNLEWLPTWFTALDLRFRIPTWWNLVPFSAYRKSDLLAVSITSGISSHFSFSRNISRHHRVYHSPKIPGCPISRWCSPAIRMGQPTVFLSRRKGETTKRAIIIMISVIIWSITTDFLCWSTWVVVLILARPLATNGMRSGTTALISITFPQSTEKPNFPVPILKRPGYCIKPVKIFQRSTWILPNRILQMLVWSVGGEISG